MATNESGRSRFLKGFLIGGFFGALAGILFAPKSGKELRSELKRKGEKTLDDTKHLYSEARDKAKAILEDGQHRALELKKEVNRHLAEARLKAKEVLSGAEEKASEARTFAKGVIEDTKIEVKRLKGALEAGVEAAQHGFSKGEEKDKTKT